MEWGDVFHGMQCLSLFSAAIPLLIYFIRLQEAAPRTHYIGLLLMLTVSLEGMILMPAWSDMSVLLTNLYYVCFFMVVSAFFYEILFREAYRHLFIVGVAFYGVMLLLTGYYHGGWNQTQELLWAVGNVILMVYAVQYACHVSGQMDANNPHLISTGLFVVAVFVYAASNLPLFFYRSMPTSEAVSEMVTLFIGANACIKNMLLGFGMAYTGKYFKEQQP